MSSAHGAGGIDMHLTNVFILLQAKKRLDAAVQPEESPLQEGRLLLEETQGWEDHAGRPHEAEGPRHRG